MLVLCNIVNIDYQHGSRVLYIHFLQKKSNGQLSDISQKKWYVFKNFLWRIFVYWSVWLADQNSEPSEMEDKINISLIIN